MSMIENVEGLEAIALVAIGDLNSRKCEEASIRVGEFFELFLHTGQVTKTLLDTLYRLAALSEGHDLQEEAEELFKLAVLIRQKIFPETRESLQEKVDEEKILDLRRRLGKSTDGVTWDPSGIIERTKKAQS